MPRKRKNVWPFSSSHTSPRQTMPASARSASQLSGGPVRYRTSTSRLGGQNYKGYKLFETADGNWHYSGEKESAFDSLKDVKRFVDSLRRNPVRRPNRDVIDTAVGTGMDIAGQIYEVPSALFTKGVQTSLSLKDAVKRKIGLNPSKQNGEPAYVYRWNNGEWQYFMTLRPTNEGEWARYVRLAQQQPDRYRIVKTRMNTRQSNRRNRRNPQGESDAMYESFHGCPSSQDVIVEREIHEHEHLAGLGDLVEVHIETPTGLVAHIQFPEGNRPLLSTSEDGKQLYIEGGDQKMDLKALGMNGPDWVKDRMVLGCFAEPEGKRKHNIAYLTEKDFDDFEPIIYEHDLGEPNEGESKTERREAPYLEYEPRNVQLYITGGQYQIKTPVFETSPGIEN